MFRRFLKQVLDGTRLTARFYDSRARARYLLDRKTRQQNSRFQGTGAPDGLPLPPPLLVYLVAGHFNVAWYYESGALHADLIKDVLAEHHLEIEQFDSLLDFGCGCGRVIRHWKGVTPARIHGTDYNRQLVDWCRDSLPFADFETNGLEPPLPYGDGEFDFVYAISVFTHLTEDLQDVWMRELERVLRPGGVLLATTKGHTRLDPLDEGERRRFERGDLVVRDTRFAGRNLCAAFHPESYLRGVLAGDLEVLEFMPADGKDWRSHDVTLLRRPA
jgi:SAM-dependent methyltransferase